jgi:hypothetical protein
MAAWQPMALQPAPSGGGGPSVASLFTASATTGGLSPYHIVTGVTFSAGVAVVGVAYDGLSGAAVTGVQINGVTATQIGTTVSDGTNNGVALFYAVVSAGSGDIVLTNGTSNFGEVAVNGWMITGNSSNTPSVSGQTNGFAVQQPDPQGPISLASLAAGSVAVGVIGRNFPSSENPTSWTGITRDASAEATNATGNGIIIAGAKASGLSGTTSVSATGSSSWQYSGMLAAAWR